MPLKIKYSLSALDEQIQLLEYIIKNFGVNKGNEIYQRIENTLELIAENPEMFPTSLKKPELRKCVFSRQTSIYYRIKEDYIEIVSFRPNGIDPKKFKL
ncbi:type II toxin-antitoxin system RelE/ParE family toxin [Algoriphagus boritolerans]|uniref:Plasmid stabilization system protein ParE n=1 Tax=Algoriphagus boritolerans DSM 17298 = JCM 18970 TaxID=1120964 RepID=A0A1H5XS57_9BACT|nr:Plasmid stabilization system protein ParE [Algoriphagus boritolerans DSM 17298 = JCM 18970]